MTRVFFTDRDLGKQFPEILRNGGLQVQRHADHFEPAASDVDWLRAVGRSGWTAITHDQRIRYKPNELRAVVEHRVPLLVVVGQAPFAVLARNFVATYPLIEDFLRTAEPPFIAKVYRPSAQPSNTTPPGSIALWYPRKS